MFVYRNLSKINHYWIYIIWYIITSFENLRKYSNFHQNSLVELNLKSIYFKLRDVRCNIIHKQLIFVERKRHINMDDFILQSYYFFFVRNEDSQFHIIQRKILYFPIFLQFQKISEEHGAQKYFNVSTYKEYMYRMWCEISKEFFASDTVSSPIYMIPRRKVYNGYQVNLKISTYTQ